MDRPLHELDYNKYRSPTDLILSVAAIFLAVIFACMVAYVMFFWQMGRDWQFLQLCRHDGGITAPIPIAVAIAGLCRPGRKRLALTAIVITTVSYVWWSMPTLYR
jgi:Na+/glutamate symporter